MNTLRNTVTLIGHLGKNPEFKEIGNENCVANFSLATNESFRNKNNEWEDVTTWHNIVAWGESATRCKQQLKKGSKVILKGKIVNDSYQTKEGETRYKTEIVVREFMSLDPKSDKL